MAEIDRGWSGSDMSKPGGSRDVGTLGLMIEAILVSLVNVWTPKGPDLNLLLA